MRKSLPGLSLLLLLLAIWGLGNPAVAHVTAQCSDAEKAHEFDFWIGEWEVYSDGKLASRMAEWSCKATR